VTDATYREQWQAAAAALRKHAVAFDEIAKKAPPLPKTTDPWTVPVGQRPTCPLDKRACTSWTCLLDVCDRPL